MMSKHPIEIPVGRKLSKDEIMDALRLSIIAELDAINLYLQIARSVEDEKIRRVFEDIAREEKTHFGEFLAVLKSMDLEQVKELEMGVKEVKEKTGIEVPNNFSNDSKDFKSNEIKTSEPLTSDEWKYLLSEFTKAADNARKFRHNLPVYKAGRGVDTVPLEYISVADRIEPKERIPIQLKEIAVKFALSQKSLDYARNRGEMPEISTALQAATSLGLYEDKYIMDRILECKDCHYMHLSDWSQPGAAVDDVSKAIAIISNSGIGGPYLLFVSPSRYVRLLRVEERVTDLERIKALVKNVIQLTQLPDNIAIIIAATQYVADIALGVDTEIEYIGPENGVYIFRARETIALRIRNPKGIVILKTP